MVMKICRHYSVCGQSDVGLIVSEAGANLASALSMQRHLSEQNDNCICFS